MDLRSTFSDQFSGFIPREERGLVVGSQPYTDGDRVYGIDVGFSRNGEPLSARRRGRTKYHRQRARRSR